ncbi:hypothetical protein EVA_01901 [gut metagenome]|uniref:Uncharacterized protein n=1 Tax=gut metagenome TaxID=749906 RepID=J9H2A7_9ZZZZ
MKKIESEPYAVGSLIAILGRKCSSKLQPKVTCGMVLRIEKVGRTKSGAVRLTCTEHKDTTMDAPLHVVVNSDRFTWQPCTEEQVAQAVRKADIEYKKIIDHRLAQAKKQYEEKRFKRDVERTVRVLTETMTWDEHVEVAIKPLIVIEMVWLMAEECRRYCAEHKIYQVLKVTRAIRALRDEYDAFLSHDLDSRHRADLTRQARLLMEESRLAHHTHIMRLTLRNEYFRQFPGVNIPYLDLRVMATLGVLFIAAYRRRVEASNRLIAEKTGGRIDRSISNPLITDRLYAQFDALLGDFVLKPDRDIAIYEKIVDNELSQIKVSKELPSARQAG